MIIVTGGAGFIGSHIVKALNERCVYDILIVDRLGTGPKWKNLRDLKYADYMEVDAMPLFLEVNEKEHITHIFHMGACSSTTEEDNSFLVSNNYECSQLLAEYAFNNEARFIYASSAATYGDGSQGFGDDELGLGELRPLNMYGYSKHMFDLWLRRKGRLGSVVGLKYFNVFGPGEDHKGNMRSMVTKAFEQVRMFGKIGLFEFVSVGREQCDQKRDFVYIDDVVDATMFFYDNPKLGGIYNVGTGVARTWEDLALAVFSATGKTPNVEDITMPYKLKDSYQYFTKADISKLRSVGYDKPMMDLETAVQDYFCRKN